MIEIDEGIRRPQRLLKLLPGNKHAGLPQQQRQNPERLPGYLQSYFVFEKFLAVQIREERTEADVLCPAGVLQWVGPMTHGDLLVGGSVSQKWSHYPAKYRICSHSRCETQMNSM